MYVKTALKIIIHPYTYIYTIIPFPLQASEYEVDTGIDLSDFFRSTAGKFKTRQVISIVEELTNQRDIRKQGDDGKKECAEPAEWK